MGVFQLKGEADGRDLFGRWIFMDSRVVYWFQKYVPPLQILLLKHTLIIIAQFPPAINASLRQPFGYTAESALIDNPDILADLQAVNLHSDAHDPMVALRPAPRLEYN